MFTLSVVLGSSILYKEFNAATPPRVLKFTFGCLSTFIGVYLITSQRHLPRQRPRPGPSTRPSLTPLIRSSHPPVAVGIQGNQVGNAEEGVRLDETPPHLLGTSFGYHFTNPRVLELRMTLPRRKRSVEDQIGGIWTRWRRSDGDEMARSYSEQGVVERNAGVEGEGRDWASEAGVEERRRGVSVV